MKKIFAIIAVAIAAVFTANVANAQCRANQEVKTVSIRPYAGMTAYTLVDVDKDVEVTSKAGFAMGVDAQYMFNNWFGTSVGAEFAQGNWDLKDKQMKDSSHKINTIGMPVLANFYLFKGFDLKLGVKPTFVLNSEYTEDKTAYDNKHELNTFDLNTTIGISYEFKGVTLELRENVGTSKYLKTDKRDYKDAVKMGNLQFTIGYRF